MSFSYLSRIADVSAAPRLVAWRQYIALAPLALVKVPLSRWKFIFYLLFVCVLAFSLARLFWLLMPSPAITPAVVPVYDAADSATPQPPEVNIEQLKSFYLFGRAESVAKIAEAAIETPRAETQLQLILLGLGTSNDQKMARAIIALEGNQDIYGVGMPLPGGEDILLVKIMTDHVIIRNKGKFESLYLYQNDSKAVKRVPPQASVEVSAENAQKMLEWQETHSEPEVAVLPEKVVIYSDDQAITEVGRSMSEVAAMSVYQEEGKMVGYRMSPGRDANKFKALGLQSGDLVIAINGWPLSDPSQVVELYNNLAGSASLQVKRGNNVMSVDIPL